MQNCYFRRIIAPIVLLFGIGANAADTATSVHCFGNGSASVYSRSGDNVSYSSVNCSSNGEEISVAPSGVEISQSYAPEPYTALVLSGSPNIEIKTGGKDNVTVSGDSNYVEFVEVNSANGKLTIHKPNTGNNDLHITVMSSTLQILQIYGAGNTDIYGDFPHGLSVSKKGAGNIHIAGQASYLELNLSGAGNTAAKNLETNVVHIDAAGAGKISACARESVSGSLSGAVNFRVYCNPFQKSISMRGATSIKYW